MEEHRPAVSIGLDVGKPDHHAAQITATSNRLRGMLIQIHPALERALGPRVTHPAVADLLSRCPTPARPAAAGRGHVRARLKKHAPGLAESLTEEIFDALGQQSVVVAGTEAATTVIPVLAGQPAALIHQRATVAAQVEALVEAPSSPGPDLDARGRGQDRCEDPHRGRGQGLRRAPGLLRRTDALFAMLRDGTLHPDPTGPQTSSSVVLAAWRRP